MGAATGIPMAVAARRLALGMIGKRGVFSPEEAIGAGSFFDELAPYCTPSCANGAELLAGNCGSLT